MATKQTATLGRRLIAFWNHETGPKTTHFWGCVDRNTTFGGPCHSDRVHVCHRDALEYRFGGDGKRVLEKDKFWLSTTVGPPARAFRFHWIGARTVAHMINSMSAGLWRIGVS